MDLFGLPATRSTTKRDQKLMKAAARAKAPVSSPTSVTLKGNKSLAGRIEAIVNLVETKFTDTEQVRLITEESELESYITACLENGAVAIDTETSGLDPIIDKLVGFSLYTPGQKAAYIPINHISYVTEIRCDNQISQEFAAEQLKRLIHDKTKTYWFNAPFDVRVLGNNLGIWFKPYFDAYIAAMCLNSAEPKGQKGLKPLHKRYCWGNRGEALSYDKLFENLPFYYVPIKVAWIYAAFDALYTWELAEFQSQYIEPDGIYCEEHGLQDVAWVFRHIEMESMPTFIEMEQNGVTMDYDHAEKLKEKYHGLTEKMEQTLAAVGAQYMPEIQAYKRVNPACKLPDPINFESNAQLAVVLYDVLGLPIVDPKKPRGVDKEILEQMNHPLANAVLDIRSFRKVISTYIDKLPETAKLYPDKRIHCKFNQYGAETGRVSSDSPNLQNIPSKPFKLSDGTKIDSGHDVRQLFKASPGHILLSCDYSGQEPRVTAHLSQDHKMIQAFRDGKDVYSEIAALSFNTTYEECCETYPNGDDYPEGAARRSEAKRIVLGEHIIAPIRGDMYRKVCEPYYSWVS